MSFYPIYLTQLNEFPVVLLGGQEEAERKTSELLDFGCRVHVIHKTISPAMRQWHQEGKITWTQRNYIYGDLKGAGFVVVADCTDEIAQNASQEAKVRHLLINVMDNMPLSNSAFGSIIRQGQLTISFSTNGLAPALAVRLKERFQREIDDAYAEFLNLSEDLRPAIMKHISDPEIRKKKWYEWVDSEVLSLLRNNNRDKALRRTTQIWGSPVMLSSGLIREEPVLQTLLGRALRFFKTG